MTPSYCIDCSGQQDILAHLAACDATFYLNLSGRVDLADYARKLVQSATRFEAWSDGRLIGLVAAYCNAADRDTAFLSNVSVDPIYTRKGIARQLMQTCIAHVRSQTFKRLLLEVDPRVQPAVQLYNTLGFIPETDPSAVPQRMCLEFERPFSNNGL